MTDATLELTTGGGLAHITLARPDALNTLNITLKTELCKTLRSLHRNAGVRAVLITAQGKHFCVGQDLNEHVAALRSDPHTAFDTVARHYNPLIRALAAIRVPVIVGIQGICAGAGWGLAMAADIRIAGARTRFRAAFSGIGLAADSGITHALTRCVGPSRAAGILMLDDEVTATQALDWGLVHRVVDDDALEQQATDIAERLANGPTRAFAAIKRLVTNEADLDRALEAERRAQEALGISEDHKTAIEAFLAKETPVFTGR